MGWEHLEILDPTECRLLLEERGVGRIGRALHGHPVIFAVNYVVLDEAIVCRARRGGDLARATCNVLVAFEIERADNICHEGWSVLAVGRSAHVTDLSELAQFQGLHLLPWAGDERDLFVRISLDEISGWRIQHREA